MCVTVCYCALPSQLFWHQPAAVHLSVHMCRRISRVHRRRWHSFVCCSLPHLPSAVLAALIKAACIQFLPASDGHRAAAGARGQPTTPPPPPPRASDSALRQAAIPYARPLPSPSAKKTLTHQLSCFGVDTMRMCTEVSYTSSASPSSLPSFPPALSPSPSPASVPSLSPSPPNSRPLVCRLLCS